ncbi:MAG TPA: GNAT family N-acyltransferase [Beijerinckiaceae bacterium]|nr:GNAT family N-acyltransferase [Beijerinckiaceae bacterium]
MLPNRSPAFPSPPALRLLKRWTPRLAGPSTPHRFGHSAPLPAGSLCRLGSLEVRLAQDAGDLRAVQRLRYEVFFNECQAVPTARMLLARRDADRFDRICDHLMVIDHDGQGLSGRSARPKVVGTYRLLRGDVADAHGGFYSAQEYDLRGLMRAHPGARVLELGRSCVLKPYRTKRIVELLWAGIWAYVRHHRMDMMIGCASLPGTDPAALALPLSFLHHHARAPDAWQVAALPDRYVPMNRLPAEAVESRAALGVLPPLVKAYLRLGGRFGDGAVVDRAFGTTDVLVIVRVADIAPRYIDFYGARREGRGEED